MSKPFRKPLWRHPHSRDVALNAELVGTLHPEVISRRNRALFNRAERRALERRGIKAATERLK